MISEEVKQHLAPMRADYESVTGKAFDHFFCPLLLKDEPVELCIGHVIPESYTNCCRAGVVQRADIDNWYGSVFEAEYGVLLEAREAGASGMVFDNDLRKKMTTKIVVDGEECRNYPLTGHKARDHVGVVLEKDGGGETLELVLARSPDEVLPDLSKNWSIVVERDCRISALVTRIKAAYLTMFHLFGYKYALSPSGLAVGRDLLGKFYLQNRGGRRAQDVRKAARAFFRPYRHMVSPLVTGVNDELKGTLEDGRAEICYDSAGRIYAMVVWVRINQSLHAVLMPEINHPDSTNQYWEFLKGEKEGFLVRRAAFNRDKDQWELNTPLLLMLWPKPGGVFDFE